MQKRHTPQKFRGAWASGVFGITALTAALLPMLTSRTYASGPESDRRGEAVDIQAFVTRVDDLDATLKVTKYEPAELEKIGSDFKTTYSVRNLNLQFKHPDKLRLEGRSATRGTALMILNGTTRFYSVPKFKLKKSEDLASAPGKRQSLLEYGGLIVPETLRFMQAQFVKMTPLNGANTAVFDLTYQGVGAGGSHYRVWLDTRTHITTRREWYDGANKLKATFAYLDPHEVSTGIWLPNRLEVKNAEGIVAAEVAFSDAKANQNLADSLFEITP
jgi:outer membrane lipoprotein-sorting protein